LWPPALKKPPARIEIRLRPSAIYWRSDFAAGAFRERSVADLGVIEAPAVRAVIYAK
jgi:hypothetical protein